LSYPHFPGGSSSRGVEASGGLVQEQQFGIADEREPHIESPALAARKAPRQGVCRIGQTHQLEHLVDVSGR
jgi:hypothetical protein